MIAVWIACALAGLAAFVYWKITRKWTYFKDNGVPYDEPKFPLGSSGVAAILKRKEPLLDIMRRQYDRFRGERFYGTFFLGMKSVTFNDLDLIRNVLVKDFDHFVDRSGDDRSESFRHGVEEDKLWQKQLTALSGEKWKKVRSTFTPIFTSGKMKAMTEFIDAVCRDMKDHIGAAADRGEEFELKQLFGKYTMDSIASCAFGVDAGSFREDESVFERHAKRIFNRSGWDFFKGICSLIPGFVRLAALFGISIMDKPATRFFYDVVKAGVEERRKAGVKRNDMVDLMVAAIREDGDDDTKEEDAGTADQFDEDMKLKIKVDKRGLGEDTVCATAMVFLIAGYDTTSTVMGYAAYELAVNPDIQRRLQEELDAAGGDDNDVMPDYVTIQGLTYLDMVVSETLRKYPVASLLARGCVKDYVVPGSGGFTVQKGDSVIINVAGIHYDPQYYPDPEKFDPERFSKEEKAKRHPYTFLTFGQGPRACIGMRFAMLEIKMGLYAILKKFDLLTSERTPIPVTIDPTNAFGGAKEPLYVRARLRH